MYTTCGSTAYLMCSVAVSGCSGDAGLPRDEPHVPRGYKEDSKYIQLGLS